MANEMNLIENKDLRLEVMQGIIDELATLNKVKNLVTLPMDNLVTTELVADFYEVSVDVIKMCVSNNRDEVELDGYKVWKKADFLSKNILLKTKRGGFDLVHEGEVIASGSNMGIALFTPRSILRVGMLLRDSQVAKQVRTTLLDIHETVMEHEPQLATQKLDELTELHLKLGQAVMNGDVVAVAQISAEIERFKTRNVVTELTGKVEELQGTVDELVGTLDEQKPMIEAYNRFINSDTEVKMRTMYKALELPERKTNRWLRDNGYLAKNTRKMTVTEKGKKIGLIVNFEEVITCTKGSFWKAEIFVGGKFAEFLWTHREEIMDYVG